MLIRVMKVKHNIKLKQLIAAIALPLAVGLPRFSQRTA